MSKLGTKQTTTNPCGYKGSANDTRPGSIGHSGKGWKDTKVQPKGK